MLAKYKIYDLSISKTGYSLAHIPLLSKLIENTKFAESPTIYLLNNQLAKLFGSMLVIKFKKNNF